MAAQTGITVAGANEPYAIVSDIERPTPGRKQALIKPLFVGINPVEPFMQHTGMLVIEWPAVMGDEAVGVVVQVGDGCTRLKIGDHVFGVTEVGKNKFSPFQETYLVDEDIIFKKPGIVSLEEACTIGTALMTSGLGVVYGLKVDVPAPGEIVEKKDTWVVVMGGSGNVGQFACQIAALSGYKVLASCSPSNVEVAKAAGASATFNGRAPMEEQLAEIKAITGGKFNRVFDASAYATEVSVKALETCSEEKGKYFATVDDWSPMTIGEHISVDRISLGVMGRTDTARGTEITTKAAELVRMFEPYVESGDIKPVGYQLLDGMGWDKVIEGIALLEAGKAAKKIIVKVHDE